MWGGYSLKRLILILETPVKMMKEAGSGPVKKGSYSIRGHMHPLHLCSQCVENSEKVLSLSVEA